MELAQLHVTAPFFAILLLNKIAILFVCFKNDWSHFAGLHAKIFNPPPIMPAPELLRALDYLDF